MSVQLTNETFDAFINQPDKLVLVDFWATWCGPCRMLAPVLDAVAEAHADKLVVGKVDVDANMDLAMRFRVNSIPLLLMFKNGELVGKQVGFVGVDELEKLIAPSL